MIFEPVYALTSDYLISCFYCIIRFGLKENIGKKDDVLESMWEEKNVEKETKQKQNKKQQKQQQNLLDVITFQIVCILLLVK